MKHVRLTAEVDPATAPEFFDLIANSPRIAEVRVLDWNLVAEESTLLFEVDGDRDLFERAAADLAGVTSVATSPVEQGVSQAFVRIHRSAVPIFGCLAAALERGALLIRKPLLVRDGAFRARIVGDSQPLQAALERRGDGVTVRIDEISSSPAAPCRPAGELSDRQREALSVALERGYYEQPRGATHADVAEALDCAPQTAGDHLQKAEAKLVRAALDDFGPAL